MESLDEWLPEEKQRVADYVQVFTSPAGRRVLDDLRKAYWGTRTTYHPDPTRMAMNEGNREVVLEIEYIIRKGIALRRAEGAPDPLLTDEVSE